MLARRLARELATAARASAPTPARAATSTASRGGGAGTDFGERPPAREQRQRRRAINGRLRQLRDADWDCGSDAGGAGPDAEEADDAGDAALAALWRRFVREARGARERARVRRAWSTWQQHFASAGASTSSAPGDGTSAGGDDDGFSSRFSSAFGAGYETWYDAGPFEERAEQPRWEHYTHAKAEHEEARARARGSSAGAGAAPGGRPAAAWAPAARADVREWLSTLRLAAAPAPTAVTLKAAFRVAAFAHHPDRHGGDAAAARAAEARFKRCVAAAEALRPLVK